MALTADKKITFTRGLRFSNMITPDTYTCVIRTADKKVFCVVWGETEEECWQRADTITYLVP